MLSEDEAEAEAAAGGGVGLCDAVLLAPLTEDTFLHNLHVRFKRDIIYTYVGAALVCVNPSRPLPLYSPELARAHLTRPPYQLPPHLYGITATAYRWVRDRNESQCIVITGESGAGKTEAARVCLQCAVLAGGGGAGGGAGRLLVAAGTLLEAFGNAATIRNHNASRFGKLLDIEFNFKGEPVGGYITHYLLEKERVCLVTRGERNFHVLYQLLAGADNQLLKRLKLQRSWECYRILREQLPPCPPPPLPAPPPPPVPPTSPHAPAPRAAAADTQQFAHTKEAMSTLGICVGGVARVLAFILKLGNAEFQPRHNIDGTIGAHLQHHYELWEACALVGVEAEALVAALGAASEETDPRDSLPPPPSPPPEPSHAADMDADAEGSCEWVRSVRDRVLCGVYARLFTWLVGAVNAALQPPPSSAAPCPVRTAELGILDTYGFESLSHNGLERLLINYCAERVAACVTSSALRLQQEEYSRELLTWRSLPYLDHQPHADLIDMGPESVLGVLGAVSASGGGAVGGGRRGEDEVLLHRLHQKHDPRVVVLPPSHFRVCHSGGAVVYSASAMCRDNRDELPPRVLTVLRAAAEPTLARLFLTPCSGRSSLSLPPGGGQGGVMGSPRRPASLAARQRVLVTSLVRRLTSPSSPPPRLVRCLRADDSARPRRFDALLLRRQIRTQGIMDMAVLRRAGWCESMCARVLLQRYSVLGGVGGMEDEGGDPVRAARALLRRLPIPAAEFTYGRTKIFIRSPRTVWELEALRWKRIEALVSRVQRAWRRRAACRQRAQVVLARAWRARRAPVPPPVSPPALPHHTARRHEYSGGGGGCSRTSSAVGVVSRWWMSAARRRYLLTLWERLPPRRASPLCASWPPCPHPALLHRTDTLLMHIHHRYRCYKYRMMFDQTARNRMREKVTCSALFRGRKALYPRSVPHPFVGDYVRLRASAAWRRHAHPTDRYVVFAELVGKVSGWSPRVSRCVCVVSTSALLLLEARGLRARRRVAAHQVYRLTLSPHRDDLLAVHVRACPDMSGSTEEVSQCGAGTRDVTDAPGCLFGGGSGAGRARRGDVLVRSCHVLELATKLFLVVQNAAGHPPAVHIADQFEANFGQQLVTVSVHGAGAGPGQGVGAGQGAGPGQGAVPSEPDLRLVRRGSRLDVLL